MGLQSLLLLWILSLISSSCLIHAQQPYVRKATTDCGRADNSTSVLGYTCNGQNSTCQSYLIFRSIPPYNTVSSISGLLASDPIQLSEVNAVSANETIETNKEVIVPVNCSCSGEYYQVNASFVIQQDDNFLFIANNTYQGLSTCQALQNQNTLSTRNLFSGTRITVPIRCACPTKNQTDEGVNYLLSYLITPGDWVSRISTKFSVDTGSTLRANEISEDDPTIFPFTTLLIPLQNPPNSTTIVPSPPQATPSPPPPSPPPQSSGKKNKTWIYIVVGIISAVALLFFVIIVVFCVFFRRKNKPDQSKSTDPIIDSKSFESYEKTIGKQMEESEEFLESISGIAQSLKVYKFEELKLATESFSSKYWIKGSVYRGTINGSLAAIKKTNRDVAKEINILNKINHFNLIKLSGVCFNEGYWYLVFEYALNGSLADWIYYNRSTKK
ncbi:Lysm receptor kinase, partial [Thalictrum thalictroides]